MIEVDVMYPVMVTNGLAELKTFYETVFGFNAVYYDVNFYLHLVSPNGAIQLGFLMPNQENQPDFLHPLMVHNSFVISLEVKDATLAYVEATKMKLPIVMDLKVEEWGQVHFMLEDPAGFRVDVIQVLTPETV
jgi:uncharacterized glyoxalase superfamily protein PhnB